ncbi:MAG: hypothetical protein OXC53_09500 [Rhodobacteraceae bacterium]|nr:hypothetical protein [Paracoccaceae bacterium]
MSGLWDGSDPQHPGDASNNGALESPHGPLKREIEDALLIRGSRDLTDRETYRAFIADIVGRVNARHDKMITVEVQHLQALPTRRNADYEEVRVRVTATRGVTRRRVFTSVPTRLMGHQLRARVHTDQIALYLGTDHCLTVPRKPHQAGQGTVHVIHDRPVIGSLKTPPGRTASSG